MNQKNSKTGNTRSNIVLLLIETLSPLFSQPPIKKAVIISFLISLSIIFVGDNFIFLKQVRDIDGLNLGDLAEEDFFSEHSYQYVDKDGTQRLTTLRLASVNGIFVKQEGITNRTLDDIDYYLNQFESLTLEGAGLPAFQALGFPFGEEQISFLLEDSHYKSIMDLTRGIVANILNLGYYRLLDYEEDPSYQSGVIEVRSTGGDGGIKTTVPRDKLLTSDNIGIYLESVLSGTSLDKSEQSLVLALLNFFLEENCYFNKKMTSQLREETINTISPLLISVEKGEKIISQGEVVTADVQQKLDAYWEHSGRFKIIPFLEPIVYLLGILLLSLLLICYIPIEINNTTNLVLLFWSIPLFIFFVILFEKAISSRLVDFRPLLIPTGFLTLLFSQLVTKKKGVMVYAIILSLLAFFLSGLDPLILIYSLITGLAGTLVLTGGEKRIHILKSGLWLGGINLVVTLSFSLVGGGAISHMIVDSLLAFLLGVAYSLLVLSLLPLFEHFLNACTAYRLAELANLNEPILKRLFIQAAGTYVHSINVAYMAEPACEAIGGNSLLARVAAYYHDMGKMDQPTYFIENQKEGNKHDGLKANLSAAIIKAHVKLGVEKGREMGLPDEVIQIIGQHHGTSVIRFFYDKAQKEIAETGKSSINRDDYCHYGPRPQTKEAAIVMMADTIEAASRTLKKPSKAKLEKFVWDLIMARLQSGELNDSGLTLNELEIIKDSFVHVLIGHFHTRIEYPDQKKEDE